ncbi:hypothetical protein EDD22DRAFT_843687 [Suillus occidentalis]|nr:hypothetical protein EDD22DRAFT_843687 [Suillus occidentalis]
MEDTAMMLAAWKLRTEGQGTLIRLKGVIKQIHKDCQGKSCARGAVARAFQLCFQILFKNTEDIAPSRKLDASALLWSHDFLDTNFSVRTMANLVIDACDRLLCPIELYWDNPIVKAGIRDRVDGYVVTEMFWPAFLYEKYTADQENLEEGLFESTLLRQGVTLPIHSKPINVLKRTSILERKVKICGSMRQDAHSYASLNR